jgi:hypothetical protein
VVLFSVLLGSAVCFGCLVSVMSCESSLYGLAALLALVPRIMGERHSTAIERARENSTYLQNEMTASE